jgi:hypothetical protein
MGCCSSGEMVSLKKLVMGTVLRSPLCSCKKKFSVYCIVWNIQTQDVIFNTRYNATLHSHLLYLINIFFLVVC